MTGSCPVGATVCREAHAELERLRDAEAALADTIRQRDEWQARHEALRADVEREHVAADEWSLHSWSEATLARILNRDDQRGA